MANVFIFILLNDGWMVDLAMGSFQFLTIVLVFCHPLDPWIFIRNVCWEWNMKQIEAIPPSVLSISTAFLGLIEQTLNREYITLILDGLESRSRLLHWVSLKSSTVPSIDRKNTLFAHYWQTEFEKLPAHIQDGFFPWERFRMNVSIESHWKPAKIYFFPKSASLTKFMER